MAAKKKRDVSSHPRAASSIPFSLPQFLLNKHVPLIISILFLVIMAGVAFTYHRIGDYGVETDFYWTYIPNAKNILSGVLEMDPFKGPGYEMVLGLVSVVGGEFFRAGILISLCSAVVVLYLTHKLVSKYFNPESAILVSLALVTNFTFLKYSYTAGTDMFFDMLGVLVLFFLLRSDKLSLWDFAVSGAITGYAYVTRYNAVAFYVAAFTGIVLLNFKHATWKERLVGMGVFIAASLVFVVPWGIYCRRETGSFFYNKNYLNIAYEMFGKGKVSWDEYWWKMSGKFKSYVDVMAIDPAGFFKQVGANAAQHFWNDVSLLVDLPLGIFAIGGIVALIDKRIDRRQAMYFVFAGAFYLVLLPVFYGERFSLYLIPAIVLLSMSFFQWNRLPQLGFSGFGIKHIALAIILFIVGKASFEKISTDIDSGPSEILQVRDAFFQDPGANPGGKTIVARKPQVAYYLKMKFVQIPYVNSLEELLANCRKERADYLFFSGIEAGMRPQFSYLLDPTRAPPALHPIVQVYNPPAVMYELKPE